MAGLPSKVQLHEKYREKGLEVITVNVDGVAEMPTALATLEKLSITTTNWCIAEGMDDAVTEALEFEVLPALNVYDKAGRRWESFAGRVDHAILEEMIESLLARD